MRRVSRTATHMRGSFVIIAAIDGAAIKPHKSDTWGPTGQ